MMPSNAGLYKIMLCITEHHSLRFYKIFNLLDSILYYYCVLTFVQLISLLYPRSSAGIAVRRCHCVGGGAPVNFGRGGGAPPGQKKRRRRRAGGQQHFFSKIHEKISFYPKNFLVNFFSHQSFEVCRSPMLAGSESRVDPQAGLEKMSGRL